MDDFRGSEDCGERLSLIEVFARDPQGALVPASRSTLRVLQELVQSEFASLTGFLPGSDESLGHATEKTLNGLLSNIAHKDAPLIVLNVPIYRAGLSRLGWRGRAAAGGAYDQFLKSLLRRVGRYSCAAMTVSNRATNGFSIEMGAKPLPPLRASWRSLAPDERVFNNR